MCCQLERLQWVDFSWCNEQTVSVVLLQRRGAWRKMCKAIFRSLPVLRFSSTASARGRSRYACLAPDSKVGTFFKGFLCSSPFRADDQSRFTHQNKRSIAEKRFTSLRERMIPSENIAAQSLVGQWTGSAASGSKGCWPVRPEKPTSQRSAPCSASSAWNSPLRQDRQRLSLCGAQNVGFVVAQCSALSSCRSPVQAVLDDGSPPQISMASAMASASSSLTLMHLTMLPSLVCPSKS